MIGFDQHNVVGVELEPIQSLSSAFSRHIRIKSEYALPDGTVYQRNVTTITLFSHDAALLRVEGDPAPLWEQKVSNS